MLGRIAAAFALAIIPGLAFAQAPRAALPFISVDGLVGGVSKPVRSGATFYQSEGFLVARVAVAVRLGSRAAFRPVAVLDYFGAWGRGDDVAICFFAPNGSCLERFPSVSGVAVGLGVRSVVGSVITVGVTGGVGRYKMRSAAVHESTTGFHADAEISLRFMKHAGVALNVRHVEAEKFQGARMWYRPVTFGVRIQ